MTSETEICICCFSSSENLINIFSDLGKHYNIRGILQTHFWFQAHESENFPKHVCWDCWQTTKTFNSFYSSVQTAHHAFLERLLNKNREVSENIFTDVLPQLKVESVLEEENIVKAENDYDIKDEEQSTNVYCNDDTDIICESRIFSSDEHQENREKPIELDKKSKIEKNDNDFIPTGTYEQATNKKIEELFDRSCDYCDVQPFKTLLEAKRHYRIEHGVKKGYFKCCGRKFKHNKYIEEHIKWHSDPTIYTCTTCGKSFQDPRALNGHLVCHSDVTNSEHICEHCGKRFAKAKRLQVHLLNVHPAIPKNFICDICDKRFNSLSIIRGHIMTVHQQAYKAVCHICAKIFYTKQRMQDHLQTHKDYEEPRLQCIQCNAWLKNHRSLSRHMRTHSKIQVQCTICNSIKPNELALRSHMRSVHAEAKHICNFCGKAFRRPNALTDHIASHTGEDLYTCSYCPKKFKSKPNMYKHLKRGHSEEWNLDRLKRQETLKHLNP